MHILLKGVVDFSKEAARLQKEATSLEGRRAEILPRSSRDGAERRAGLRRLGKTRKKMAMKDYATKCPAATQAQRSAEMRRDAPGWAGGGGGGGASGRG